MSEIRYNSKHSSRLISKHGLKALTIASNLDAMFASQQKKLARHCKSRGLQRSQAQLNRSVYRGMSKALKRRFGSNGLTNDLLQYLRAKYL